LKLSLYNSHKLHLKRTAACPLFYADGEEFYFTYANTTSPVRRFLGDTNKITFDSMTQPQRRRCEHRPCQQRLRSAVHSSRTMNLQSTPLKEWCTQLVEALKHCATNRKVAGSIPVVVSRIFH